MESSVGVFLCRRPTRRYLPPRRRRSARAAPYAVARRELGARGREQPRLHGDGDGDGGLVGEQLGDENTLSRSHPRLAFVPHILPQQYRLEERAPGSAPYPRSYPPTYPATTPPAVGGSARGRCVERGRCGGWQGLGKV